MNPEELKASFDKVQNAVAEIKTANDEAIKNGVQNTAEFNTRFDKLADDLTKHAEEYNSKLATLEAMQNQPLSGIEKNEQKEAECIKQFNKFAHQKTAEKSFFSDYLERNGIERNALSISSDPDGGYLVLPTYKGLTKERHFETSPIRQLASAMTITGDRLIIDTDNDEASSGWVGEKATRSETDTPQTGQIEIPMMEIYAMPKAYQTTLDYIPNIESWLSNKVFDKFNRDEATAHVTGNGVVKPRGLMSYPAWAVAGTYEEKAIEQINSGVSALPTADGLMDLQNALLEPYQPNATFLMKRAVFGLVVKLKDGDGQYLFNRNLDKSVGTAFDLLGQPVRFANDMAAAASNSLSIAYGDIRRAYQIIDKSGMTILRDPYTTKGSVLFYTTKRTGGAIQNFEALKIQKFAV